MGDFHGKLLVYRKVHVLKLRACTCRESIPKGNINFPIFICSGASCFQGGYVGLTWLFAVDGTCLIILKSMKS